MATENGLRMVRQYSDEGRNAAIRVNDNFHSIFSIKI